MIYQFPQFLPLQIKRATTAKKLYGGRIPTLIKNYFNRNFTTNGIKIQCLCEFKFLLLFGLKLSLSTSLEMFCEELIFPTRKVETDAIFRLETEVSVGK